MVCGRNSLPTFWFNLSVPSSRVKNTRSLEKSVRNILCFVDRTSLYICVMKTNLMHNLHSVYFVNHLLHISGIIVAHHQELILYIYRVSQEECARLREGVPYVKLYRYNPKHLCPKLNRYGDNGQRKVRSSGGSTHCTCQLTA